jgi:hypothetical protein
MFSCVMVFECGLLWFDRFQQNIPGAGCQMGIYDLQYAMYALWGGRRSPPGLQPARANFPRRRLPHLMPIKTYFNFPVTTSEFGISPTFGTGGRF